MSDPVESMFHVCTVERQHEVALKHNIPITGTLSPITTAPLRLTDEQVAECLRLLEGIPDDRG